MTCANLSVLTDSACDLSRSIRCIFPGALHERNTSRLPTRSRRVFANGTCVQLTHHDGAVTPRCRRRRRCRGLPLVVWCPPLCHTPWGRHRLSGDGYPHLSSRLRRELFSSNQRHRIPVQVIAPTIAPLGRRIPVGTQDSSFVGSDRRDGCVHASSSGTLWPSVRVRAADSGHALTRTALQHGHLRRSKGHLPRAPGRAGVACLGSSESAILFGFEVCWAPDHAPLCRCGS